jgi:hypothetical protein
MGDFPLSLRPQINAPVAHLQTSPRRRADDEIASSHTFNRTRTNWELDQFAQHQSRAAHVSCGSSPSFGDACSMSALPESGHCGRFMSTRPYKSLKLVGPNFQNCAQIFLGPEISFTPSGAWPASRKQVIGMRPESSAPTTLAWLCVFRDTSETRN